MVGSGYCPHKKTNKHRKGFAAQKDLQNKLQTSNYLIALKKSKELPSWKMKKLQREKNWKIIKELSIIFVFLFPIGFGVIYHYLKTASAKPLWVMRDVDFFMSRIGETERVKYILNDNLSKGYEALVRKDFQRSIYYFNSMRRYETFDSRATQGLLGVYLKLCKDSELYCYAAEELLAGFACNDEEGKELFKKEILAYNQKMIEYYKRVGLIGNDLADN